MGCSSSKAKPADDKAKDAKSANVIEAKKEEPKPATETPAAKQDGPADAPKQEPEIRAEPDDALGGDGKKKKKVKKGKKKKKAKGARESQALS